MKFGQTDTALAEFRILERPKFWFQSPMSQGHIYFGSTNWTEAYWKTCLYPPKTKPQEYLYHHSRYFDTIELNTTFYRNPDATQVIKWKESTPATFRFCPKVPSRISQSKLLGMDSELWKEFENSMLLFESQLGPCFLQLPEYFDSNKYRILQELIIGKYFSPCLLIELRNETWFTSSQILEELCLLLSQYNNGLVITDTPGRQDVLHNHLCCEKLLVRYVSDGNPLHDHERLYNWSTRIDQMRDFGIKELHFIFHHPDPTQIISLTQLMRSRHTNA